MRAGPDVFDDAATAGPAVSGMAARIAAFDWAATPLGPMGQWPQSLRTAVSICTNSRFPMFVWWGPAAINIYNDAYMPILGKRHPAALGRPARELWHEIWPTIGPQVDAVMLRGESSWHERVRLDIERNGFTEEAYFTWSHSPIHDENGGIGGLFCACTEETQRVLTERDRDREAGERRRADDRARTILESITDGFFALDADWRFSYLNPQGERLLGRDDLIGKDIWTEYPGLIGSDFETLYRRARTERSTSSITAFYPDHDRWYEVHAYPAPQNGISVYFRDASERIRAEDALRQSEHRLAAIVRTALDCVVGMDHEGRVTEWNPAAEITFGYRRHEAIGQELAGLIIPPALRERHRQGLQHYHATGHGPILGKRLELAAIRKDGTEFPAELTITRVHPDDPPAFTGYLRDITERRQAETAVRESEERLRLAIDIAQMGTFEIDLRTDAVTVNDAGRAMYGWAPGEPLTFDKVQSQFHPEDRAAVLQSVAEAFGPAGSRGFEIEQRIVHTNDEVRWIRVRGRAIFENDAAGVEQAVRCRGTYLDITAVKEAERERERLLASERAARVEAEHASRMKDEFLATLSHELRTPLNAILGWSQIIRGSRAESNDVAQGLEVIERNARAQAQIIEDLLDMSRIISGKVRLEVQHTDLSAVVLQAIETARPTAVAKGVGLHAVIHPPGGVFINGDAGRFQQVLWNLLSNAIKFTPNGGNVRVRLERLDTRIEISVIDTGEGIRPDFLPFVFDRFRQADASTTRRHGGLGLGLSIVKQLVELHGGTVRVASDGPGRGSTFGIALPLTVVPIESEPQTDPRHPPAATNAPQPCVDIDGVRVLVVDDEPDARAMTQHMLRHCGAVVATAASATEALERLTNERFDVLVSDISMPGEDGYALLRRVRELGQHEGGTIPAIALTANARAEDRATALAAGFRTHVAKPVEPAELIASVAAAAKQSSPA